MSTLARVSRQDMIVEDAPGVIINGTTGNDVIDGTQADDTINGGGGNDTIIDRWGDDIIDGGDGDDVIIDEAGSNTIRGGAVHTTEFNCTSDDETLDNAGTVLFRKRDFLLLERRLKQMGAVMEFNFNLGQQPLDLHIDTPPYSVDEHLKLQIQRWAVTSFGLIIRKT